MTWFETTWHVPTAKIGMSAKTLESTLGDSYTNITEPGTTEEASRFRCGASSDFFIFLIAPASGRRVD